MSDAPAPATPPHPIPSDVAATPGASSLLGERGRGELAERMGIEFTELSADRSVATAVFLALHRGPVAASGGPAAWVTVGVTAYV